MFTKTGTGIIAPNVGRTRFTDAAIVVLVLCAAGLVVNLFASDLLPLGHDEVLMIEPAINLLEGRGFTSSLTKYQPTHELFVGVPPLWGLMEAGWLHVTGANLYTLRASGVAACRNDGAAVAGYLATWIDPSNP